MALPSQWWLRVVLIATTLVFLGMAVVLYGVGFAGWLEADAGVAALLAAKVLHAKLPIVGDWYYANGDVWVLAPHLFALVPVAILGVGPVSLLVSIVGGLVLEIAVYARIYARLAGERWVGGFAAMVTLMAWSRAHVRFVYIQLAYGFLAMMYLIGFGALAALAAGAPAPPRRWAWASLFVALVVVQNPTRGLVFVLAPVMVGCAWPWRQFELARRLAVIATVTLGWLVAALVYTLVFQRAVSFAYPPGHIDFAVKDAGGIVGNLKMLWRGLLLVCGGNSTFSWRVVPSGLVMLGALALVWREIFAARALTALRFVCVIIAAQLAGVLVPLVIGNLMIGPTSVRYTMPSFLVAFGLASVLAIRALGEAGRVWRWLATGWLVVVPIAALLATPKASPPKPKAYVWSNARELLQLSDELARRGLTHGYSNLLNANLLNLGAAGRSMICPVYFSYVLIPQRWLADTSCYTASALPDRFYVVADHDDRDDAALRATLPLPAERFHVGPTYEVSVFRTAEVSLAWFELPIHDGDELHLPLRLPASHLAIRRGEVALDADQLVATGRPGIVVSGPDLRLPRGTYRVVWHGSTVASAGELTFTVATDVRHDVLARATVPANAIGRDHTTLVELTFVVDRAGVGVEFPVVSAGGARVEFDDMVLEPR